MYKRQVLGDGRYEVARTEDLEVALYLRIEAGTVDNRSVRIGAVGLRDLHLFDGEGVADDVLGQPLDVPALVGQYPPAPMHVEPGMHPAAQHVGPFHRQQALVHQKRYDPRPEHPVSYTHLDVYKRQEPGRRKDASFILGSLGFSNDAGKLSKPVIEGYIKDRLRTSVTRLEKFASCPFAHFAGSILGLKERELYKLEPPGMGMFMHEAMNRLFSELEDSKRLAAMEQSEIADLVKGIVDELAPKLQNEILLSSARYRYMARVLERILNNAVAVLAEHEKHSSFQPIEHEVVFGEPGGMLSLIHI